MTPIGAKSTTRRDWREARAKCDREPGCRVCGEWEVDAAHVLPRSVGGRQVEDAIVPLCRRHHREFDSHQLDLMPYLTKAEQAEAVMQVGIERARKRISGS